MNTITFLYWEGRHWFGSIKIIIQSRIVELNSNSILFKKEDEIDVLNIIWNLIDNDYALFNIKYSIYYNINN